MKQKLGWLCILVGAVLIVISMAIAQVSFVNSAKLFWDFSLGVIFLFQIVLAIFLGCSLFYEENERKTLHLVLSSGVSKAQWLFGNAIGIWSALTIFHVVWLLICLLISILFFPTKNYLIIFQSQFLLALEILLVIFLSIFISFFMRKTLAFFANFVLMFYLHSIDSLERVFTDPDVGYVADASGTSWVLWVARFFPPLEWFDIKVLVGFGHNMSIGFMLFMLLLAVAWSFVFYFITWIKFENTDL